MLAVRSRGHFPLVGFGNDAVDALLCSGSQSDVVEAAGATPFAEFLHASEVVLPLVMEQAFFQGPWSGATLSELLFDDTIFPKADGKYHYMTDWVKEILWRVPEGCLRLLPLSHRRTLTPAPTLTPVVAASPAPNIVTTPSPAPAPPAPRPRREVGMTDRGFLNLINDVENNSTSFECDGRILRLKDRVDGLNPDQMLRLLQALERNDLIEVLYIYDLGDGLQDPHMWALVEILKRRRIWALNIGETDGVSSAGWRHLLENLESTALGYLYISETVFQQEDLRGTKVQFIERLRTNRVREEAIAPRDLEVVKRVNNMWWNPKNRAIYK